MFVRNQSKYIKAEAYNTDFQNIEPSEYQAVIFLSKILCARAQHSRLGLIFMSNVCVSKTLLMDFSQELVN